MDLVTLPSTQNSISFIDASPPDRRATVQSWVAHFEAVEVRLDAVTKLLERAVVIEQKEVLIEAAWEVLQQALEQELWRTGSKSQKAFKAAHDYEYIFRRMLMKQGVDTGVRVSFSSIASHVTLSTSLSSTQGWKVHS